MGARNGEPNRKNGDRRALIIDAKYYKETLQRYSVRLVSVSDKLHNARAILRDYHIHGEDLWNRFNGGKNGTLRSYRSPVEAFSQAEGNELIEALDRLVSKSLLKSA